MVTNYDQKSPDFLAFCQLFQELYLNCIVMRCPTVFGVWQKLMRSCVSSFRYVRL